MRAIGAAAVDARNQREATKSKRKGRTGKDGENGHTEGGVDHSNVLGEGDSVVACKGPAERQWFSERIRYKRTKLT